MEEGQRAKSIKRKEESSRLLGGDPSRILFTKSLKPIMCLDCVRILGRAKESYWTPPCIHFLGELVTVTGPHGGALLHRRDVTHSCVGEAAAAWPNDSGALWRWCANSYSPFAHYSLTFLSQCAHHSVSLVEKRDDFRAYHHVTMWH